MMLQVRAVSLHGDAEQLFAQLVDRFEGEG